MVKQLPKPKLATLDDLFTTQEQRDDMQREKIMDIAIAEIDNFPNHSQQVRTDDEMRGLVESVREYGVLSPAIARPKENGRYELVSGHRRKVALELAGLETLPVIVREMDDDTAIVLMVDTNKQRERVLPSEKAKAYRMKLEAMKRQGKRTDLTSAPLGQKSGKTSRQIVGDEVGESQDQVRRYIRLTELIPEILQMVDEGKMAFRPAVEISYLTEEEQHNLSDAMGREQATPSLAQAIKLKELSRDGKLSSTAIRSILKEPKPNQIEMIGIPRDHISCFFKKSDTPDAITETILKALDLYRKRERSRDAR